MLDSPTSTPSENRLLLWLTLLPILALITVLAMNLGLSLFRILTDPEFLRGYGVLVSEITMVSIIGWVLGVGAGALISRSQPVTESMQRFLRLGMWLPFFVFGNLTYWGDMTVWN